MNFRGLTGTRGPTVQIGPIATVTVDPIPNQLTYLGGTFNVTPVGHDSASNPLTWSATGLPAGASIDPTTGHITGTATTGQGAAVTVTATDAIAGSTGSASFFWTIPDPDMVLMTLDNQLAVMHSDGTGLDMIGGPVAYGAAVWSPDHSRIAFMTVTGSSLGDLYIVDAWGQFYTHITNVPAGLNPATPSWSPDGSQIAAIYQDDPTNHSTWVGGVVKINVDNSGHASLAVSSSSPLTHQSIPRHVLWSPDGTKFAIGEWNNNGDIEVVLYFNADGTGGMTVVATDADASRSSPPVYDLHDWYADSAHLLVNRWETDGTRSLLKMALGGSSSTIGNWGVPSFDVGGFGAFLSPDESKIIAYYHGSAPYNIDPRSLARMPAAGGTITPVAFFSANVNSLDW